jgi:RhtB (resistance to homoserine/threonine) family protein
MNDFSNLFAIAVVSLVAAVSPGPDFFIVVKNSLSHSRKSGFMTALGVSLALLFHLTYALVGLGVLIAESPLTYALIKYAGVGYLFYLGLTAIITSFKNTDSLDLKYSRAAYQQSNMKALRQGFLTNLLNPKAAVFFISLFSQFIDSNTSIFLKIEYGFINWAITLAWFIFISYLITAKGVVKKINRFQVYIDRVMGGMFMLLGTKLLFV